MFRDIAVTWVTAFPSSAAAMEALAVALDLLGNPAAVDTLRRARALATTLAESTSTAAAEVWMQVKLGAPGSPQRLRHAKLLADSLLRHPSNMAVAPQRLAAIAALTGHAGRAASLVRRAALEGHRLPPPLAETAPRLLVFASLGGPTDSLRALEQRVISQLSDPSLPDAEELRLEWLGRPAELAAPILFLQSISDLRGKGNYLLDAQAALAAGDVDSVRRVLGRLRESRRAIPPADRAIDAVYLEAVLFTRLGDDQGAIDWMDPTLHALALTPPGTFDDPARPGPLVNAMALRAELASRDADAAVARRWAEAVCILWSDADEFLQPVVRRMKDLVYR